MLQRLNLVSERRQPRSEWRRPRMERRSLLLAMTLFCATAITLPAHALDTVKFMIGANPGGGFDQTARNLGAAMIAAGQAKSTSYDNRGGAGGTIALAQFVNSEKANPAALIVTGAIMVGAIETNRPPVTLTSATPIARLFADTMILVVAANSPIQSVKDVAEHLSWKDSLKKNDWSAFLLTGDEFATYVDAEHKRIGATLRALGVAK